jgi:signal transduction histidine kinase
MTGSIEPLDEKISHWRDPRFVLRIIQLALPLILFGVVFGSEAQEHLANGLISEESHFITEILFFGVLGPAILYLVFSYIQKLLKEQIEAKDKLEKLNLDLEAIVASRTVALEQRNVELIKANNELKELDHMKSDFVALVSHELRAPLTVLNGGLEIAVQQADALPLPTRRTIAVMARESERLTHLVQTILDLSRLEAGKLPLTMGPTAVLPILERVAESVLLHCDRPIKWDIENDLPPVWADETYLEEIVCNLVRNADKYSQPHRPIHFAVRADNGYVSISVIDHGPGIPAEIKGHLFERFYRGKYNENTSPGWGLGLYFARKLTEAQGGRINLRSPCWEDENGPGAQFTVTLKVTEIPEEKDEAEEGSHGRDLNHR